MSGNTWGRMFRITTWGESHGPGVGVVIDGCPPGIALDEEVVQAMLDRRKPGRSQTSTRRREEDRAVIMSGFLEENEEKHLVELGMDYFLKKPFSMISLNRIIDDFIASRTTEGSQES